MNPEKNVTLDVRDKAPIKSGYKSVVASDGSVYYFKYSGGDEQHDDGTVTNKITSEEIIFEVSLTCADCYIIESVGFTNHANQLTAGAKTHPRKLHIHNQNNAHLNGRYTVIVKRLDKNVSIPCDPPIINHQPS